MKSIRFMFLGLCVVFLAACGGGGSDTGTGGGSGGTSGGGSGGAAPWAGTWVLVAETGGPAGTSARPGTDYFVNLTLTASTFHSEYSDTLGQACSWDGTINDSGGVFQWATSSASGFPCSQAVGRSGAVTWSMPNNNTLILDFRTGFAGGTLQTYSRT